MVRVDKRIQAGVRVTVALGEAREVAQTRKGYRGKVVAPTLPRTERGLYWGYTTRVATTLSAVFDECPYEVRWVAVCVVGSADAEPDFRGVQLCWRNCCLVHYLVDLPPLL